MSEKYSKPRLIQVGLVVRDLDKTVEQFRVLLGAEPNRIIERSPAAPGPKYYMGEESDFFQRVALYDMNGIEFEILQPYGGRSALSDFLDTHGEGIHHVAFDTDNFDALEAHMKEHGVHLIQTGPNSRHPALKWGFFDTNEKLGTMIELTNFEEVDKLEAAGEKK